MSEEDSPEGMLFMFAAVLNVTGPVILTEEYLVGFNPTGKEIVVETDEPTKSYVIRLRKEEDVRDAG